MDGVEGNWGLASFRAQQFAEATGPLARQVARQPGDAKVREALAMSYFMVDKFDKTREVLQPLLADLPGDPGVPYALGVSLVRKGDSETASRVFRRMLWRGERVRPVPAPRHRFSGDL